MARLPQVGDEVSFAFNGDSHPCGKVASVSKTYELVTTTEGQKFYRRDTTAKWVLGASRP